MPSFPPDYDGPQDRNPHPTPPWALVAAIVLFVLVLLYLVGR